jgi:hypothetical protein
MSRTRRTADRPLLSSVDSTGRPLWEINERHEAEREVAEDQCGDAVQLFLSDEDQVDGIQE